MSLATGGVLCLTIASLASDDNSSSLLFSLKLYWWSILTGFLIEAYPRSNTRVQELAREKEHQTIFDQANFGSQILYFYPSDLLKLGASRPLREEDVPDLALPVSLADESFRQMNRAWQDAVARQAKRTGKQPALVLHMLYVSHKGLIRALMVTRLTGIALGYALPECIKHLIWFVEEYSEARRFPERHPDGGPSKRIGYQLVGLMFMLMMASTIVMTRSVQDSYELAMALRAGLTQMVYQKSLVLSPEARQANSLGAIVNHMSVDAEVWFSMGWSIFGGILVVLAMNPVQTVLGRLKVKSEAKKLFQMDLRVRMMNEILTGIKIIKLYGWEDSFKTKIEAVRQEEIEAQKRASIIGVFMKVSYSSATLPMALVTFALYSTIGGPGWTPGKMTAEIIVVSVALFGMLNRPIALFGHAIGCMINAEVCMERVQKFLLADEIDPTVTQRYPRQIACQSNPNPVAIELRNATVSWSKPVQQHSTHQKGSELDETVPLLSANTHAIAKAGRPTLLDISLTFHQGSLTAIVGRVGQGKSSLLSAILGEMYRLNGSIKLYGTVAYVPQQPWIIHATVRANILFGKPFNQAKYDRIIHGSGLEPDLAVLPAGDLTEIGERGINLSGGQKQRVSMARAAYQEADIYLLDDPLSAVDAHVDQHLWEQLIGPNGLLKDKTRVLVTHGIHHLEQVDQIVILKNGTISEVGQYAELMSHRKAFYQLIREYSVERKLSKDSSNNNNNNNNNDKRSTQDSDACTTRSTSSDDDNTSNKSLSTLDSDLSLKKNKSRELSDDQQKADEDKKLNDGSLVSAESVTAFDLGWPLYFRYAKAASYNNVFMVVVFCVLAQVFQIATNLWLRQWVDDTKEAEETGVDAHSAAFYLIIYGLFIVGVMSLVFVSKYISQAVAGTRAALIIHDQLMCRVLRLPMSFFDTTPMGRVLNRFSSDIGAIDTRLPSEFDDLITLYSIVFGTIVVIGISTPLFLLLVPFLFMAYGFVQNYYLKTSASIKTMTQVSRSPVYSHFSETLSGVSSIRSMDGVRSRFINQAEALTNVMTQRNAAYMAINRWLQIRLESLGAVTVLASGLLAVWRVETMDAALVGIALGYAITITVRINFMVRTTCEIQNMMVSLDRIQEYSERPTEAPTESGGVHLPERWPQSGHIRFIDYSARYRLGLDLAVKHVSFEVQPGEKIGIVGRTGAGKSSLTLALFRIIEAANSYWAKASEDPIAAEMSISLSSATSHSSGSGGDDGSNSLSDDKIDGGSIIIDGVDISTIGLKDLRQRLSIIPQDPTLFAGTLRENLDPFDEKQDADLWRALERAHLKDHISTLQGGLSFEVAQNGENFSVGQRSLICLARALLRDTTILVLDEATSSVDMETDELIQRTIRTEFKDRTILTIAHRIKTVMDYDKILVLEKGQLVEFEPPSVLLQRKDSLFYGLAEQAGEVEE
ncbi:hypothetical protein DFQ27_003362 [Actinomortierella ambigua]|uniref:P-loop containing nucleoside triphosphate hydrolase protein n=1 Tax=Actinomortierella ambigua TaxID=1343610 RepID=A0A9P6Q8E0_9FUNG|nr:hypothetical protein DFQ27_003362 [Actinomortierella ambigua]